MFRMTKPCFNKLCTSIIDVVGEREFKSEQYLNNHISGFYIPHNVGSGGYISGEVKLAISLHLLAGASYLDVEKIFHVLFGNSSRIFLEVLQKWICNDRVIKINFI